MKRYLLINLMAFFFLSQLYAENLNIKIDKKHFFIDNINNIILCHYDLSKIHNVYLFDSIKIIESQEYYFRTKPDTITYSDYYTVTPNNETDYKLFFTRLPIISIETKNEIVDEPKVLADFSYSDTNNTIISSLMGIEYRGGWSQTYPKKSFDIEFRDDIDTEKSKKVKIDNLREDDDWVLDALYNEPLRVESYFATKLWFKLHSIYYKQIEPDAKCGADVIYVELFLNSRYLGIYTLGEQVDKKQLKLKSSDNELNGELYKGVDWGGALTFDYLMDYDNNSNYWGGYELKYPDKFIDWSSIYAFTDFVINSSDDIFINEIADRFNIDNAIDYFIFVNLIRATDNSGKNIYISKYDRNSPYMYSPWDLDGCLGTDWNGNKDDIVGDILANGLQRRLLSCNPDNYCAKIAKRWWYLRSNILQYNELQLGIDSCIYNLAANGVFIREQAVYSEYLFEDNTLKYKKDWLRRRIDYLDSYFSNYSSVSGEISTVPSYSIQNPCAEICKIINNLTTIEDYSIRDILGNIVINGKLQAGSNCIPINAITDGLYFVKIGENFYKLIKL